MDSMEIGNTKSIFRVRSSRIAEGSSDVDEVIPNADLTDSPIPASSPTPIQTPVTPLLAPFAQIAHTDAKYALSSSLTVQSSLPLSGMPELNASDDAAEYGAPVSPNLVMGIPQYVPDVDGHLPISPGAKVLNSPFASQEPVPVNLAFPSTVAEGSAALSTKKDPITPVSDSAPISCMPIADQTNTILDTNMMNISDKLNNPTHDEFPANSSATSTVLSATTTSIRQVEQDEIPDMANPVMGHSLLKSESFVIHRPLAETRGQNPVTGAHSNALQEAVKDVPEVPTVLGSTHPTTVPRVAGYEEVPAMDDLNPMSTSPDQDRESNSDGYVEVKDAEEFMDAVEEPAKPVVPLQNPALAAVRATSGFTKEEVVDNSTPIDDEVNEEKLAARFETPTKFNMGGGITDGNKTVSRPGRPRPDIPSPIRAEDGPTMIINSPSDNAPALQMTSSPYAQGQQQDGEREGAQELDEPVASPPQQRAMNSTFNSGGAMNTTFNNGPVAAETAEKAAPINRTYTNIADSPSPAAKRHRQQTMVVETPAVRIIREIFASVRTRGDVDDAEKKALAVMNQINREATTSLVAKDKELEETKHQMEIEKVGNLCGKLHVEELISKMKQYAATLNTTGAANATASADTAKLKQENEQLSQANDSLMESYRNVWGVLDEYKKVNKMLTEDNEERKRIEERIREVAEEWKEKYSKLLGHAKEKLEGANAMIADLESRIENGSRELKLSLRQKESALVSTQQQLEIKTAENNELNDICQQLLARLSEGDDSDSVA